MWSVGEIETRMKIKILPRRIYRPGDYRKKDKSIGEIMRLTYET